MCICTFAHTLRDTNTHKGFPDVRIGSDINRTSARCGGHTPVTPTLTRLRQENHQLKASPVTLTGVTGSVLIHWEFVLRSTGL